MNPYEELANAIIEQAVKDFRIALVGNLRYPSNTEHIKNLKELQEFFLSGWFSTLTDLDGEYLMNRVLKMVKKEMAA